MAGSGCDSLRRVLPNIFSMAPPLVLVTDSYHTILAIFGRLQVAATGSPPHVNRLMRQRVGAQLKLHDKRARQGGLGFARGARDGGVDALDMLRRAVARARP